LKTELQKYLDKVYPTSKIGTPHSIFGDVHIRFELGGDEMFKIYRKGSEIEWWKDKRRMTMKLSIFLFFFFACTNVNGQKSRFHKVNVLFIGNSYIYYNDLPKIFGAISNSLGDSVYYNSSTPGGYTLEQHSKDSSTLNLIKQGKWDFVVLQEQSQLPSLPIRQVEKQFYPFALQLDSIIHTYNKRAKTIFYMTWGRKNGDASMCNVWKPVCNYEGMDSLIAVRYSFVAHSCNAIVSPVGRVWRHLVHNNPDIDLYDNDGGHPSIKGSYLAACCFYTTVFRKNPELITFNFKLTEADSRAIKKAVKTILYDELSKED
jgi:hypothetical protein